MPVDIRLVAATNDDLQTRARQGQFRADLYFRLAQCTIALPALRDRPEDVPYLAQRFLEEAGVELRRPVQQLTPPAIEMLQKHRWPGNVRELRNVIRQAVLRTRALIIKPADLRAVLSDVSDVPVVSSLTTDGRSLRQIADDATRSAERHAIVEALRATRGNRSRAARVLQIDYKTMHVKLKKLGIRATDFQV
jgi:two-component system nitrogen regulation response regulator GlnG